MRNQLYVLAAALAMLPPASLADSQQTPPANRDIGRWTFSGSLRLRPESWAWFGSGLGDGSYTYLGSILRFAARQQSARDEILIEAAVPGIFGLSDRAIHPAPAGQLGLGGSYVAASAPNAVGLFLKQAYIRRKDVGGKGGSLRFGRFEFMEGTETSPADPSLAWLKRERIAHRLIGNFGWSHVGRSFDGLQFSQNRRDFNLTAFFGVPTRGVFDVHGMDNLSDVRVGYLAGTWQKKEGGGSSDIRLFGILYQDDRDGVTKVDNRPANVRTADREEIFLQTVGGHYALVVPAGRGKADLLAWVAGQFGDWGAQRHEAWAFAIEGGFQPAKGPLSPWLRAGFNHFSGDDNPLDDRHQTFIPLLPTPRIYARFPFFTLANLDDAFVQLLWKLNKQATLRTDFHRLWLAEGRDLWYQGGGAFQDRPAFGYSGRPGGGSTNLASLFDASLDYALSASTTLALYGAYAHGGGAIRNTFPGRDAAFGYVEVMHRW